LVRKELDERFGREVVGFPESVLAPGGALEILRMKLAQGAFDSQQLSSFRKS
jgi:hypothetical protein